jgi:dipeptidyl aminopeptidase/acylaminoacyl peptidase
MSFVDSSRLVALGASYGGYMVNWIQGHPLGRRFKALVSHDGIFNIPGALLATDELYYPEYAFGGRWHENKEGWLRWNPADYVQNWSTPQLVIHSTKDYRLCISEGLATFNALQSRGIKSQFLTFPDESHWVLRHENSLLWHAAILDWINEAVGLKEYSVTQNAREVIRHARAGTGRLTAK